MVMEVGEGEGVTMIFKGELCLIDLIVTLMPVSVWYLTFSCHLTGRPLLRDTSAGNVNVRAISDPRMTIAREVIKFESTALDRCEYCLVW